MKPSEEVRKIQFAFRPDDSRCRRISEIADKVAQLEEKIKQLRGRIEHAELFDGELPNSAYSSDELLNGIGRIWESLNDAQKQFWIDRAHQQKESE